MVGLLFWNRLYLHPINIADLRSQLRLFGRPKRVRFQLVENTIPNLPIHEVLLVISNVTIQSSLLQLSILIGLLLGFLPCLVQNAYYLRSTLHHNNIPIPERRLPASVLASIVGLTGGLFWYAFASSPNVRWIFPTIGLAFIGFGVQIVVTAVALYTAEAYSLYAGSALSAVGFGENLMAAWLPLASRRLYRALGFRWASALLAFAALALTAAPVVLLVWGKEIRGRSRFIREAKYLV